jgi:hypothetical protein
MRFVKGIVAIVVLAYVVGGTPQEDIEMCYAPSGLPRTFVMIGERMPASEFSKKSLRAGRLIEVDSAFVASSHTGVLRVDAHGLIVQANGDGGDTAQRTGMFYFVHRDPKAFSRALDLLEIEAGVFVRHPYQDGFRSNPSRFSRDQQRPLVIALGAYGMHDRLWRLFEAHLRRLGKYQNRDYIGPVNVGEYIRAFKSKPLYPLLFVTDVGLIYSSLDIAVRSRFDPDDVDDNNHLMSLIQSQEVMDTPLSWLARKVYRHLRGKNLGNSELGESEPVQGAIAWYHRNQNGGNTLIPALYRNSIERL